MPWLKVDDKLHDHRKARKAGKAAMGVWVLAGSWAMDNLTDGFVPEDVLSRWGTKADAARLVTAGLWVTDECDGDPGWRFHDWARFQPSAAVTAAVRAKEAAAGVLGNHKRWHAARGITDPDCEYCYRVPDQVPDQVPEGVPESPPIRPEPVPVPVVKREGADKPRTPPPPRRTRFPDDFTPSDSNRRIARERGLNLRAVFEQFRDHHVAKGSTMVDWHAAFNTWLRRESPQGLHVVNSHGVKLINGEPVIDMSDDRR